MNEQEACSRFVEWLDRIVLKAARGDDLTQLSVEPSGRFWLGRICPESAAVNRGLGDRGERLDPCAIGIVVQPSSDEGTFTVSVRARAWLRERTGSWKKSDPVTVSTTIQTDCQERSSHAGTEIAAAFAAVGARGLMAEVRVETRTNAAGRIEKTFLLVNT